MFKFSNEQNRPVRGVAPLWIATFAGVGLLGFASQGLAQSSPSNSLWEVNAPSPSSGAWKAGAEDGRWTVKTDYVRDPEMGSSSGVDAADQRAFSRDRARRVADEDWSPGAGFSNYRGELVLQSPKPGSLRGIVRIRQIGPEALAASPASTSPLWSTLK